jgi:hypothetical protein
MSSAVESAAAVKWRGIVVENVVMGEAGWGMRPIFIDRETMVVEGSRPIRTIRISVKECPDGRTSSP